MARNTLMDRPRWSDLVEAFGLDQPFTDPKKRAGATTEEPPRRASRIDVADGTAPADSDPDVVDEAAPADSDPDVAEAEEANLADWRHDPDIGDPGPDDPILTGPIPTDPDEGDIGTEPIDTRSTVGAQVNEGVERRGALLLSDAAELATVGAQREVRRNPVGVGDDRFEDLGFHVAHAMRVAYDAVGEMKRLEEQIAALLLLQDSLRETLTDAADELHRRLAGLSFGDL